MQLCGFKLTSQPKQQHALSIAIFSNYLILDTILCAIPRFLILGLLQQYSSSICTPASSPYSAPYSPSPNQVSSASLHALPEDEYSALSTQFESITKDWTPEGCSRIVWLAQLTSAAGVVAATLLQFVGALYVREYAKGLWVEELREEGRMIAVESGIMPIVLEESDDTREKF
jgi:hypothetical protein